ncbi:MAG TPA: hypothetical protein DIS88_12465 [Prevotella sp.]|nr:hypothetical protein [Prevotella sp.]
MSMDKDIHDIDSWIVAMLDGNITESDLTALRHWTDASEANRDDVYNRVRSLFAMEMEVNPHHVDVDDAFQRFLHRIGDEETESGKDQVEESSSRSIPLWMKVVVAAAIFLVILIPWISYHVITTHVESKFSAIAMEAPDGSQLNLILPDSTEVKLNSGSILRYSQGYGITDRNVFLQGEGYFKVKHQKEMPFKVYTPELVVSDLGTEFDVCSYQDDDVARVDLFAGKAGLDNRLSRQGGYILQSGDRMTMDKRTGEMKFYRNVLGAEDRTEMNDLYFEDMSIPEIAKILSRSYGVRIEVSQRLNHVRFYGFFNRKEDTLGKILQSMSNTGQIKYKYVKGKYVMY